MSRTAIITGASAGIGQEVARQLAAEGWRIIGTGRDPDRMATALADIRGASITGEVDMVTADMSLMASVEALAGRINELTDRVDLLVNNAGGMSYHKQVTVEGLEANFAGNHLGAFLLTQRLLPSMLTAAKHSPKGSVRVLNTSSAASEMIDAINFDDIQGLDSFDGFRAYCTSKLANVLFTRSLAERLKNDDIIVHAVHPGTVLSNFYAESPPAVMEHVRKYELFSAAEGADTLVWLATAPEGSKKSGGYWFQRAPRIPHPSADDSAVRDRLWSESEKLIVSTGSPWPD